MQKFYFIILLIFSTRGFSQTHSGHGEVPNAPSQPINQVVQKSDSAQKDEIRVPIDVPPAQQTKIGLRVAKAEMKKVEHTIRTVGTVTADQTKEAHVHTKLNGWIEKIYADSIGKSVKKGSPLFDLYSPDLVSTQEEYLAAREQGAPGQEIAVTALERLKLWGVPLAEIERLKKTGKAQRTVTFDSPVDGFIVNKTAIQGMYITPEMELYHIADLSRVWIIITLYEYDVAVISVGDEAEVQSPYDSKLNFRAKINYISPEIEIETRTAKARIEAENKSQKYKPGMYVNVILKKDLGQSIVVPDDAVLDTGIRKIVFIKSGTSRFEPREVKLGPRVENQFAILSGLKIGEEVVIGAHFFIDTESKLRAAVRKNATSPAKQHGGH